MTYKNRWFCYHQLFGDFLRSELKRRCSAEEIAALQSRASRWFAENGSIEELVQRLQNKEIAEKLFISTTTVKRHLQNIYGKLNVSKRREAVEKVKKIGILSRGM